MPKRSEQQKEIWKPINGYKGFYEISNKGRVKSLSRKQSRTERILKNTKKKATRYEQVGLNKNGELDTRLVHRLVACHFIPNPDNKPHVNHLNGKRDDNRLENLEWVTQSENTLHAYKTLQVIPCQTGRFGKEHNKSKAVLQFDLKGNLVKKWDSGMDAVREGGFDSSCISRCCSGESKTHRNYKWKYE